ncbi:Uncharacterised protein [Candidatus Tiddalikarchaeum anstoanum]|nr:Uncharacterised protein [Candidatus Tiddalikarchaeum anstoanum]
MKHWAEYILLILLIYAVIELLTAVFVSTIYSSPDYLGIESLAMSKLLAMQVVICIIGSFVFGRSVKK